MDPRNREKLTKERSFGSFAKGRLGWVEGALLGVLSAAAKRRTVGAPSDVCFLFFRMLFQLLDVLFWVLVFWFFTSLS